MSVTIKINRTENIFKLLVDLYLNKADERKSKYQEVAARIVAMNARIQELERQLEELSK